MFKKSTNNNKNIIIPKHIEKHTPVKNNIKINHKNNDYDNIRKIVEENENPIEVNEKKNVKKKSLINNIV